MKTITGVFPNAESARRALENLEEDGVRAKMLARDVRTTDTEQPGMGPAVGGVLGGAIGVAAATALIPGIGAVLVAGAAALGVGGAIAGAAAGQAIEHNLFEGLPADELFFYEDAIRQGHAVVIAAAVDSEEEEAARSALETAGAESIDAARDQWWLGLRDDERAHYRAQGGDFDTDEAAYRCGFQAAVDARTRGKSYDEALDSLKERHPEVSTPAFRHGYERGTAYYQQLIYKKQGGWIHG